ncbi:MAG: DUF4838 domain-containing protein [Thermoguttaceae bacterium]|nr:DUF4838 domain-containing protein [Thermoguttaceae bacterium]
MFKAAKFAALAIILPLVLASVSNLYGAEARTLTLFGEGVSPSPIVLPEEPSAVQKTAAEELASFLGQVTGAEFPIIGESAADQRGVNLVIGPSALSKKLLAAAGAEPEETIAQDGIIIHSVGNSIVFSGHPQRGPLYAVYTFLEDVVGIRWWTSTESFIPHKTRLEISPLAIRYAPRIITREAFYLDPRDGQAGGIFSARVKANGNSNPIPPEYGGHETFCFFVHSFYPILPPEKYFDEHPEWYSLVDGVRTHDRAQLCLTNPEMKKEFIRNALRFLKDDPDARIISISQNDWGGWCQCPECQKLVDENGSQAGPLITFVNDVAEAIEKEHPDVFVETLAYSDSRFAPKKVKPRDNVLVRLCSIEYSFLTPLAEGGTYNQSFVDCLEKWSAIAKQLYIWDYVTDFSNYMLPHPNLQVLAPNIRFFVKNRVIGVFEQGDTYCTAGDFVRLRNWVISKLLWNPDLDQRQLEEEFLNGYYSPKVGAILREYLDVLTESALRSDVNLRCYMYSTTDWLDTTSLLKATDLMNRAIDAAREDEASDPRRYAGLVKKLERESIPIRYVWLLDGRSHLPFLERLGIDSPLSCDRNAYYEQFKELLAENQVVTANEWQDPNFEKWLDSLKPRPIPSVRSYPPQVKELPNDCWIDTHEDDWMTAGIGEWIFSEDDPKSCDGRTIRIAGNHHQWIIMKETGAMKLLNSPSGSPLDEEGHFRGRILLSARCDTTEGAEGEALDVGIYDWKSKKGIYGRALTVDELAGDDYKTIDLGEVELGNNLQFWVAPKNRPEEVPNIYVDRIIFIRQ